uniref:Retinitis pigmentosa 9 protein n=1 Tax=Marmota marmota marmota TaxID=9994 RepID=A0A8C5ZUH5_MARMA
RYLKNVIRRPGWEEPGLGEHELRGRRAEISGGGWIAQQPQQLKHLESFYEKPPPGLMGRMRLGQKMIPDIPGNEHAREFLAHAPTKGLWMPLGKEVKVMQCWCCRRYGHREGDKECPLFIKGNQKLEVQSTTEDPMYDIIQENKRKQQLKQLLEDSTSDEDGTYLHVFSETGEPFTAFSCSGGYVQG